MQTYAINTCGSNLTKTIKNGYSFPLLFIHLLAECIIAVAVYILSVHIASYALPSSSLVKAAWNDVMNGRHVAPSVKKQITNLTNSNSIAVMYFLTQVAALVCWIGAGITTDYSSDVELPWFDAYGPNPIPKDLYDIKKVKRPSGADLNNFVILCKFPVLKQGNVVTYTIQCKPPNDSTLDLAVTANYALCFIMVASTLIHLLHTFIVSPLMQKGNTATLIQEAGEAPVKVGVGYGFSNLHMVTSFCQMSTAMVKLEDAGEKGEIEMLENKNSSQV